MKKLLTVLFLCLFLQSCNPTLTFEDYEVHVTYVIIDNDSIVKRFNDTYAFTTRSGSLPCLICDNYRLWINNNSGRYCTSILVYNGKHQIKVENFDYDFIRKYDDTLF